MKQNWLAFLLVAILTGLISGCSPRDNSARSKAVAASNALRVVIRKVQSRYAPDRHLAVFSVAVKQQGNGITLLGEVSDPRAKAAIFRDLPPGGYRVTDRIRVLPGKDMGRGVWGIACLSVASAREAPDQKAEMGTQVWMGHVVRLLKQATNWFQVQCADGYCAYVECDAVVRCTKEEVGAWHAAPLLIVTALEDCVLARPQPDAQPVSDVVAGCLVRKSGEQGGWFKVELPDHRTGYLPESAAMDYKAWQESRRPTPDNIERTAKRLLGRPYLWGCNSPKGLDCSGFTQLVYFLNGIDLERNASEQALQGTEVPIDAGLSRLKKGDLLFFGGPASGGRPEQVTHVGIYLGGKLFIQSSGRVRISSLDPRSPLRDERRISTLLLARRVLPGSRDLNSVSGGR